jgi:capsular exopolysaccharide synthesis family protein
MIFSQADDPRINIGDYLGVVKRYKWSIIAMVLLGAIIGGLKAMSGVPVYRATVTMVVEPDFSSLASANQGAVVYATAWRFYETQYDLLRSRAVAERVVEKMDLVNRGAPKPRVTFSIIDKIKELVISHADNKSKRNVKKRPLSAQQEKVEREALAALIQGGVSVRGGDQSQLVYVSFDSVDPKFSSDVANSLVGSYIDLELESRLNRAKLASNWLTERLNDLRDKLTLSEQTLQEFQSREGMIDLKSIEKLTSNELGMLNQELIAANTKYSELAKRYGPKHPKMLAARADLDATRRRLSEASRRVVDTRTKEFELAKLEREVSANRELYDVFLNKFRETDLSVDSQLSSARVVDQALTPKAPFKPDKAQILTLWGLIGFSIGVLIAFLRDHLDNTFNNIDKIEQRFNLPVLGVVPLVSSRDLKVLQKHSKSSENGHIVGPERYFMNAKNSSFSESVNHIRTGIMYSNVDDPPQVILITSSVQAEGKTTLATNLALSLAQLGDTLLIDADLRKPRLGRVTTTDIEGGLIDFVAGTRSLRESIKPDAECPELSLLGCGVIPPNPLELLSSQKMENAINVLKDSFSHIIIDTAPILPVSDAIVLSHMVDSVVMVIQSEHTTQNMVRDALRRLEAASIVPLGFVLSKVSHRRTSYYYDGKYNYYYGGYQQQQALVKRAS